MLQGETTGSSVMIKVSEGKTFANVLEKLRKEVNPDANEATVVSARMTQKGDFLILLYNKSNSSGFTAEVKRVVSDLAEVRADHKKVPLASEDEVKAAIRKVLQSDQMNPEVKVLNPNRGELKFTVVVLPEKEAAKLEELSHLKVGITSCRVGRRAVVTRCLRYLVTVGPEAVWRQLILASNGF